MFEDFKNWPPQELGQKILVRSEKWIKSLDWFQLCTQYAALRDKLEKEKLALEALGQNKSDELFGKDEKFEERKLYIRNEIYGSRILGTFQSEILNRVCEDYKPMEK